jgi:hypothetical protein
LALDLYDVWYFIMGFLLCNGVPHFVFGSAGKIFRSPFGQKSPPRVNVLWGVTNFLLATVIGAALAYLNLYDSYSLILLLAGFWLMALNFGFSIKRFLSE